MLMTVKISLVHANFETQRFPEMVSTSGDNPSSFQDTPQHTTGIL